MSKRTIAHLPAGFCLLAALVCYTLDLLEISTGLIILGFTLEIVGYLLLIAEHKGRRDE